MISSRQIFAALAVAATATFAAVPAQAGVINEIVFFGDSLVDTGNVWYATGGFPPEPYNQGSSGGGPDFTGGQWSDPLGPSWSSVFAAEFGLFATPSLVGGNNYAWGGARTGTNADPTGVPWLDQQVALYAATGAPPTSDTLVSITIGGNTVANNLGDPDAITDGIASIVAAIDTLYDLGIRDLLVANVPDIGVTPRFQELDAETPGLAALGSLSTAAWNEALLAALDSLALPGADIALLDLYGLGKDPDLLAGFANTTDPCLTADSICDDPASYFYWDSFHPSSTAHALIADAAVAAVVPAPGALALLCLGLAVLFVLRRRSLATPHQSPLTLIAVRH